MDVARSISCREGIHPQMVARDSQGCRFVPPSFPVLETFSRHRWYGVRRDLNIGETPGFETGLIQGQIYFPDVHGTGMSIWYLVAIVSKLAFSPIYGTYNLLGDTYISNY